jgi:mRNA interferase MazF
VNRGEIWTAAVGSGFVGKPRPVVIVRDDRFDATASVTVCAFTTDPTDALLIRLLIEADEVSGRRESSRLMVDKITTIPAPSSANRVDHLGFVLCGSTLGKQRVVARRYPVR